MTFLQLKSLFLALFMKLLLQCEIFGKRSMFVCIYVIYIEIGKGVC